MDGKPQPLPIDYVLLRPIFEKATQEPRFAVCAAFEAMAIIGGCWRGYGQFEPPYGLEPTSLVVAPLWAVDTLGAGWMNYRSTNGGSRTLGEALRIEGGGQGKAPLKAEWNRWFRNLRLAGDVHEARQRTTIEIAVENVARHYGVSESTVSRAWSQHRREIETAAAGLRTSGGHDSDQGESE